MIDGRLVVVGPGRVGQSLAAALAGRVSALEVRGRGAEAPSFLSGLAGVRYRSGVGFAGPPGRDPSSRGSGSGSSDPARRGSHSASSPPGGVLPHLVFAVPDDRLPEAVRAWADAVGEAGADRVRSVEAGTGTDPGDETPPSGPVALHTSGARGLGALDPLEERGFRTGIWHPLAAVARPDPDAFREIVVGIAGAPEAVALGRSLAAEVGARPMEVEPGQEARYHAAAVFASNFLVASLGAGLEELRRATGSDAGLEALLPLARSALDAVDEEGITKGATGPFTRGDAGTVERHLEALSGRRRRLYADLARELLHQVGDRLAAEERSRLRSLLGETEEEEK